MEDKIVEAVRADLLGRSKTGIVKYKTTLCKSGLSLRDFLQHSYEETLDNANYLKAAIIKLDEEEKKQSELETWIDKLPWSEHTIINNGTPIQQYHHMPVENCLSCCNGCKNSQLSSADLAEYQNQDTKDRL